MRKQIVKTFAAVMCSVAVAGSAGIFASQAQEAEIAVQHVHNLEVESEYEEYEEANSQYHWKYVRQDLKCSGCTYTVTIDLEEEYLPHNLNGYANGKWYCTDCGYEE